MSSLFLAFIVASLATLGGREAVRVARLSASLGRGLPLLVAGLLACASACLIAAGLGATIAAGMAPGIKTMLVPAALLLAAAESMVLRVGPAPAEPTRAFAAVFVVLVATQLTSASALLVFALAAASPAPWPVAAGGAIGSGAAIAAAWSLAAEWEARLPLGLLRYGVAALLLAAALATVLAERGLL